jgi:hypothetical protein
MERSSEGTVRRMEWVRAFLAITLGVIALQPARAAVGIARDMHTTRWPESLTRWALVNRLYLVAFDVVTIYVYAVLGVNSIATITLLMFTCGTLVVAFLQRTGTLARLSPRTRRIVGCVQCPKWLAPLVLFLPSEPRWPLVMYLVIGVPGTISILVLRSRAKQDKDFARFLMSGR